MSKLPEVTWTPDYKENAQFYDEDRENLRYESIDEYMSECAMEDRDETIATLLDKDHVFEVFGHERDMPSRNECRFLELLIESVEEDRGDPDGEHSLVSADDMVELKRLESEFIDKFLSVYRPWGCKPVVLVKVPFRAWFEAQTDAYKEWLRDQEKEEGWKP